MKRALALISGRGSNLRSLIEKAEDYRIEAVYSDKAAPGLEHAREAGIETRTFLRADYEASGKLQLQSLCAAVLEADFDLVLLAGFMRILPSDFVQALEGKLINIHPSLLPDFKGLHTHRRALEEAASEHGCSVHLVDSGVDTGQVLAQASVPVLGSDSEEELAARVLEQEHRLYPWASNAFARGELSSAGASERVKREAKEFNFRLLP